MKFQRSYKYFREEKIKEMSKRASKHLRIALVLMLITFGVIRLILS